MSDDEACGVGSGRRTSVADGPPIRLKRFGDRLMLLDLAAASATEFFDGKTGLENPAVGHSAQGDCSEDVLMQHVPEPWDLWLLAASCFASTLAAPKVSNARNLELTSSWLWPGADWGIVLF